MKIECHPTYGVNLKGKIVVLRENILTGHYDTLENYFYRATDGFGCAPEALGSAVFTIEMFGQEKERWDRRDFQGWMTQEEFEAFCVENNMAWKVLADDTLSTV